MRNPLRTAPLWFRVVLVVLAYAMVQWWTGDPTNAAPLAATLVLFNVGEGRLLRNYFNKLAPSDKTLRLFKNNITPAETDTAATYTEADWTGYAGISIAAASWTVTEGAPSQAAAPTQDFTSTANQTAQINYGYYTTDNSDGVAQFGERFGGTPPTIQSTGDKIQITPQFTAD